MGFEALSLSTEPSLHLYLLILECSHGFLKYNKTRQLLLCEFFACGLDLLIKTFSGFTYYLLSIGIGQSNWWEGEGRVSYQNFFIFMQFL